LQNHHYFQEIYCNIADHRFYIKHCNSQWRKTIEKVGGGTEFNNIIFFYLSVHNQQLRSEGTLRSDTKIEILAQMRSNAKHLLLAPSVARERFLDRGEGQKI